MKILIIDRESLTNQLITSKLVAKNHTVIVDSDKNKAFEKIKSDSFDCIMIDPYPLSEARPVIIGIWKCLQSEIKPYIMLLSKTATREEAITTGVNDVLNKPLSSIDIETKIGNAERLMEISRFLIKEDPVPSTDGLINKSAFNQLFLSAIDRSFRYGERSLIVFVKMTNYEEIIKAAGKQATETTLHKLMEKMNFMRRQSDVIGRLGSHNFGVLLQRPQYESEPMDAINRFSEILDKFYNEFKDKTMAPKIRLDLIELPQGALHKEILVPLEQINKETINN